jgi:ATP-dependent DNA helicase RecG
MHRNYQRQEPIQIIRYSNRLEVSNPGYSLKAIDRLGEPGSEWRNPSIASIMHEMGFAETKGSGIKVMRLLMEKAGLSPPSFESDRHNDRFTAIYLFHHFLTEEDIQWLGQFQAFGLDEGERRALVFVRETGRITNADYRDVNRVETLTASQHLTRLRDMKLLKQVPRGAATYYVPGPMMAMPGSPKPQSEHRPSQMPFLPGMSPHSTSLSGESPSLSRESQTLSRESQTLFRESLLMDLPKDLQEDLHRLGQRSRDPEKIRKVILRLCAIRAFSTRELSELLGRNPSYLQTKYLNPLLHEKRLGYRFPDEPNRPDQAYLTQEISS